MSTEPTITLINDLTMQLKKIPQGYIATCSACPDGITPQWFSADFWQQQDAIEGQSCGRYTTWFIASHQQHWVLRHYYRGGLIAKVCHDSYLFSGINHTRAVAELALLEQLYQEQFPVPKPIAAHVQRRGISYRADILIERIDNAADLVAILAKQTLTASQWQQLGQTLAKFHQRGVYHADLNAKNILFDQQDFYLIDFDRGELRQPNKQWQQANIDRLLRSFNKEKNKLSSLNFSDSDWQQLMLGYMK